MEAPLVLCPKNAHYAGHAQATLSAHTVSPHPPAQDISCFHVWAQTPVRFFLLFPHHHNPLQVHFCSLLPLLNQVPYLFTWLPHDGLMDLWVKGGAHSWHSLNAKTAHDFHHLLVQGLRVRKHQQLGP